MSKRALTFIVALAAGTALAQTANRAAAEKQIMANENAVNAAFEKHDLATIQKHLLPDGVSVDPGGVMQVSEMFKMLPDVKVEPGWKLDSGKVTWIDDNTAIHTYRFTGKTTIGGQPVPSPTWSSTVWVLRNGQWRAAFHQETTAMAAPPPPPVKKK